MIDVKKTNKLLVSGMYITIHHAIMQWITSNVNLNTKVGQKLMHTQASIKKNYENILTNYDNDIIMYFSKKYFKDIKKK